MSTTTHLKVAEVDDEICSCDRKRPAMRKEYDFTEGVRGKYAKRIEKGTNLVLLESEVAKYFPTAKSVNRVSKRLISEGKGDLPHRS